jgi:hypothetical protein
MLEAAFGVLQTYSLVQWRDDRGGYAVHKLVHVWGQDRLGSGAAATSEPDGSRVVDRHHSICGG